MHVVAVPAVNSSMVYKCVAAGCSNSTSDKVTIFKFPSDPVLRSKWEKQVQRTCADWKATKHSHLCSEHFTDDSFEVEPKLATSYIQVHSLSATQDASVQCELLLHPTYPVDRGVRCNLGPSSSTPTHDPFESDLDATVMDTSTGTYIPSQESSSQ